MPRKPLNTGDNLELGQRRYVVDAVIGDGATCIAYAAHFMDSRGCRHQVVIKECYPYHASVIRTSQMLEWQSAEERSHSLDAFESAYEKLMAVQNEAVLYNSTSHAFDLFEANNTLYSVVDRTMGKSFADDKCSLSDSLKTVLALTRVVEKYHQMGYLHLDIKPDNFLILPETRELVILYDVDSVVSVNELRNGQIRCISYSQKWAAPEQKQGRISKLCPATDLFAIGSILFERVMGRSVENDDVGIFADWDFENELFDEVNPKIKRLLAQIFKKTLAANVSRRYQSAGELISVLEEAVDTVRDGKPYLLSSYQPLSFYFLGREREMERIQAAFSAGKRAVFLHGEGGIGKSSLAIAYGSWCERERKYDAVLFHRYKNSLESLVDDLTSHIQNCNAEEHEKRRMLNRLLDGHTLIIVDNFDVEIDEDDYLEEFLRYKANIIFTSRTDFSSVFDGEVLQMDVEMLKQKELRELFEHHGHRIVTDEQLPWLERLLKYADYNTLATELFAKQIAASGCSVKELYDRIVEGGGFDVLSSSEKIRIKKDGLIQKQTIPQIIRRLYQISKLNETRHQVLRNLYLLRFLQVDWQTYMDWTRCKVPERDAINDLIELSWVRHDGQYYSLHPLVEELVKNDLKPDEKNCRNIYWEIQNIIFDMRYYHDGGEAAEYEYKSKWEYLCAFFESADLSVEYNRTMLLEWLTGVIDNEDAKIMSVNVSNIYKTLKKITKDVNTTPQEKSQAQYIILTAWVVEHRFIYFGESASILQRKADRESKMKEAFSAAVCFANSLPDAEKEEALDKIYALVLNADRRIAWELPEGFARQLYMERPHVCRLGYRGKEHLGLPLSPEDIAEKEKTEQYLSAKIEEMRDEKPDYNYDEKVRCSGLFVKSEERTVFIRNLIADKSKTPFSRAELVNTCIEEVLSGLKVGCIPKENFLWPEWEEILALEEEFLLSDECDFTKDEEYIEWNEFEKTNRINRAIIYAVTEQIGLFEETTRSLIRDEEDKEAFLLNHGDTWSTLVDEAAIYYHPIDSIKCALVKYGKAHYVLPHLIHICQRWKKYVKTLPSYEEKDFFSLYKTIAECAGEASKEQNVPEEYQMDFREIEADYHNRMNQIVGANYTVKPQESTE